MRGPIVALKNFTQIFKFRDDYKVIFDYSKISEIAKRFFFTKDFNYFKKLIVLRSICWALEVLPNI